MLRKRPKGRMPCPDCGLVGARCAACSDDIKRCAAVVRGEIVETVKTFRANWHNKRLRVRGD